MDIHRLIHTKNSLYILNCPMLQSAYQSYSFVSTSFCCKFKHTHINTKKMPVATCISNHTPEFAYLVIHSMIHNTMHTYT